MYILIFQGLAKAARRASAVVGVIMEIPDMLGLFEFDYLDVYKKYLQCERASIKDVEVTLNFFSKVWLDVIVKKFRYTWLCHHGKQFDCGLWDNVRFYALRISEKLGVIPGLLKIVLGFSF